MLSVVKMVVFIARNAEEIVIASEHISLLMHFIAGIYIYKCMPSAVAGSNCGHIYMPSMPRELMHVVRD